MAHPFDVEVVAVDRKVYSGKAVSMVLPGADGYFGVLSGHAPLIAALGVGMLTITVPDNSLVFLAVSGGYAEITQERVIVLAETAERAEDIDIQRARQAMERAQERLNDQKDGTDIDRARAAMMRALNRLHVAESRS